MPDLSHIPTFILSGASAGVLFAIYLKLRGRINGIQLVLLVALIIILFWGMAVQALTPPPHRR